jgi:hypothetical protein
MPRDTLKVIAGTAIYASLKAYKDTYYSKKAYKEYIAKRDSESESYQSYVPFQPGEFERIRMEANKRPSSGDAPAAKRVATDAPAVGDDPMTGGGGGSEGSAGGLQMTREAPMILKGGGHSIHIKEGFEYTLGYDLLFFLPQLVYPLVWASTRAQEMFNKYKGIYDVYSISNVKFNLSNMTPYSEAIQQNFQVNLIANASSYNARLKFDAHSCGGRTAQVFSDPASTLPLSFDLSKHFTVVDPTTPHILTAITSLPSSSLLDKSNVQCLYNNLSVRTETNLADQIQSYTLRTQLYGNKPMQYNNTGVSTKNQVSLVRDRNHLSYFPNTTPMSFSCPSMPHNLPMNSYYIHKVVATDGSSTSVYVDLNKRPYVSAGFTDDVVPMMPYHLVRCEQNGVVAWTCMDYGSTFNPHVVSDRLFSNTPSTRGMSRTYDAVSTGLKYQADNSTLISEIVTCIGDFSFDLSFSTKDSHDPATTATDYDTTNNYVFSIPPLRVITTNADLTNCQIVFPL